MLRLYDTLDGRLREFRPLRGKTVRIYTCGPSVYNYSHIGNFRTYLFEDVLVRYLRYRGFRVKRVMNITDIEDKSIAAARKTGVPLKRLVREKTGAFFRDFDALMMLRPDVTAKASEHIPQMIRLIQRICRAGCCRKERDGIYFDVRRFPAYGKLRRLRKREYRGLARGDDYALEGLWDFRLWKRWSRGDGDTGWVSPFGFGRPGWHIECSAMAMHYLGESFDIHCGGTDNIFPHHENEIAQSGAATGRRLANFWLHSRHLTIGKRKMSKRTGNVLYLSDVLRKGARPECLRFYLLSRGYRKKLDFSYREFWKSVGECRRTGEIVESLKLVRGSGGGRIGKAIAARLLEGFESAMDRDLDTGRAFRHIFREFSGIKRLLRKGRLSKSDAKHIERAMERIDSVLGVF